MQLYQNPAMLVAATERLIDLYRHQAAGLKRVLARRHSTEDLMEELQQLRQKRRQLQDEIDYALQHTQVLNRFVQHVDQQSRASAVASHDDEHADTQVST